MLLLFSNILKYNIKARDSELGKVKDIFFDVNDWSIKYLVVDTQKWLPGKKVLLSPQCIARKHPVTFDGEILVDLDRQTIEKAPTPEEGALVNKKITDEIDSYYSWQPFWVGGANTLSAPLAGVPFYYHSLSANPRPTSANEYEQLRARLPDEEDLKVRSCNEILRYRVITEDDEDCKMRDFLVDTAVWQLLYLKVSTGEFFGGNTTLIPPPLVESVSWIYEKVRVKLKKSEIEAAPAFELSTFNEDYENRLLGYYFKDSYEIISRQKQAG